MKKRTIGSLAMLLVLACALPLFAERTMPVAVMELKSRGVPGIISGAVSDIVRSEFVNIANFEVAERAQIDRVLREQGLQQTGITDQRSAVKIGKLLSVRKMVIGEISPYGKGLMINLRMVDVESGVSEYSERVTAAIMDDAEEAAVEVSRKLAQRIVQKYKKYFTAKYPSAYYTRAIIPGWGQFYADRDLKGWTFMSLFVATGALSVYTFLDYRKKDDAYHDVKMGSAQSEFDSKYNDYKDARDRFAYSVGAFALVYAANWIDILWFSRPNFDGDDVKQANYEGGVFMDVNMYSYAIPYEENVTRVGMCMRF